MSDAAMTVSAERLTKRYRNGVIAAHQVSVRAAEGEVVGIVGPNGAGKSTTLKMLATLIAPSSGAASIFGIPISRPRQVRPLLGVALQDMGLDPLMRGHEHFEVQAALSGIAPRRLRSRSAALSERFSLTAYLEEPVGSYSGGTQRRLALALALLTDPSLVIFDEPTAGLDPRARREVWSVISELSEERRTILFSTQYLEEADRLCDRIYLIDGGRVVADGSPTELKRGLSESEPAATLDDVFFHHTKRSLTPEPLTTGGMDLGTRMHRGGGKRWN